MSFGAGNIALADDDGLPDFDFSVNEVDRYKDIPERLVEDTNNDDDDIEVDDPNVDAVLGIGLDPETNEPIGLKPSNRLGSRYLTETQLLSNIGLNYIKRNALSKLKKRINSKDEYKNLTNFLIFYQLWGHKLFPKANFGDFLTMTRRFRASKRVNMQREIWINEETMNEEDRVVYTNTHNENEVENGENNETSPDENIQNSEITGNGQISENPVSIEKSVPHKHKNTLFINDEDEEDEDDHELDDIDLNPVNKADFSKDKEKAQIFEESNEPINEDFPNENDFDEEFEAELEAMRDLEQE